MSRRYDCGNGAVVKTGRYDFYACLLQECNDALGRGGSSDVDVSDPLPQKRVAHRTSDKPGLDASGGKGPENGRRRRLAHPRLGYDPMLLLEFRH